MKRTSMMKSAWVALLAALALTLAGDADHVGAASPQVATSFPVGTRVNVRCMILASALTFPSTYLSNQTATLDGVGSVYVDCDAGKKASIRLTSGLYPAAGSTNKNPRRRMRHETNFSSFMTYNLYEDAARTVVWDDWRPGLMTARSWPLYVPVYGRINAGQTVQPGTYSDTIIANLFW